MDVKTMKETLEELLPFAADVTYGKGKLKATFATDGGQQFGVGVEMGVHTAEEVVAEKIQDLLNRLTDTWERVSVSQPKVTEESVEESTEEE